jgi:hypothetical protein
MGTSLFVLYLYSMSIIPCSQTIQTTQARFISGFGWGLTKRIENHGLAKFKANIQKVRHLWSIDAKLTMSSFQSREGVALVLRLLREKQTIALDSDPAYSTSLHGSGLSAHDPVWKQSVCKSTNHADSSPSTTSTGFASYIKRCLRWQ